MSKHISSYILIYIQFSWKILHFKKSIINLLYLHGTIHSNDHLREKTWLKNLHLSRPGHIMLIWTGNYP